MKKINYIVLLVLVLSITACSQKQLHSMYDNKTPIYKFRSSVYEYESSVDPLDKHFENSQSRPSYDEYRKR